MHWLKLLYLSIGLALLAAVLAGADLGQALAHLRLIGWGAAAVLALSFLILAVDALTWQIALEGAPIDTAWFLRLLRVRLVGEALNSVVPAGGMGGEPVKALLLNRHYGVGYSEGAASIVLGRTVNMMAQVLFLLGGVGLGLLSPLLPAGYGLALLGGLLFFLAATVFLFLTQRYRLSSRLLGWIRRHRFADALAAPVRELGKVEAGCLRFYTGRHRLFLAAFLFALLNWFVGAVEVYLILDLLGRPVAFADAWIIEAAAQLLRAGTFFIPASLGAQEGGFLLIGAALTGAAPVGLALAVARRLREVFWIAIGLALGSWYSLRPGRR